VCAPIVAMGLLLHTRACAARKLSLSAASCAARLSSRSGLSVGAFQLETPIASLNTSSTAPARMLAMRWAMVWLMLVPSLLSLAEGARTRHLRCTSSHQKGAGEWEVEGWAPGS